MAKVKGLRWYILALGAVGTVINYLDRNVLGILAPQLKEELHFSMEQYSYIVAAFGFSYAFMQPVAGHVIDFLKLRLGLLHLRPGLGLGVRAPSLSPAAGNRWPAFGHCWAFPKRAPYHPG